MALVIEMVASSRDCRIILVFADLLELTELSCGLLEFVCLDSEELEFLFLELSFFVRDLVLFVGGVLGVVRCSPGKTRYSRVSVYYW